jgi:hypothetical protein
MTPMEAYCHRLRRAGAMPPAAQYERLEKPALAQARDGIQSVLFLRRWLDRPR